MRLLRTLLLILAVSGTAAAHHGYTHPYEDAYRVLRNLDCEKLEAGVTRLEFSLLILANGEGSPRKYEKTLKALNRLREIRDDVCTSA